MSWQLWWQIVGLIMLVAFCAILYKGADKGKQR